MKGSVSIAVLVVVVAAIGYLILREPVPKAAQSHAQSVVEAGGAPDLEENPATGVSEPAVTPTPVATSSSESAPQAISHLPQGNAGSVRKVVSVDFSRHLVSMLAGEAGLRGDSGVISMIQQQYGLDEQELEAFLEYSESALQADRDYQRELQNQVCNRRTEFQTLNSFGLALNEIDRKAEEHQESLGRQAEQALGLALFSKINNVLLREPPKEVTVSDFPVLFAGLDLDLHEQIERFCGILE